MMTIAQMIAERWQDYKAWRRGERRIAPHGARGRVYESIANPYDKGEQPGGGVLTPHKTEVRLKARVIHADGSPDTHYDLGLMKGDN